MFDMLYPIFYMYPFSFLEIPGEYVTQQNVFGLKHSMDADLLLIFKQTTYAIGIQISLSLFILAQRLSHGIGVQKQKSFHYSNLNGDESSESQTEEKGLLFYVPAIDVLPTTGNIFTTLKKTK